MCKDLYETRYYDCVNDGYMEFFELDGVPLALVDAKKCLSVNESFLDDYMADILRFAKSKGFEDLSEASYFEREYSL